MDSGGCRTSLAVALACLVWCSAAASAQDTSAYRDFRLGMTVAEVAAKTATSPADTKIVFERPLLIQELEWRPRAVAVTAGAGTEPDSVALIVFGFCKGELYRMVVSYDPDRTEGLTDQDLIEALSAAYGPAQKKTSARIITSRAAQTYTDTEAVVARWEDARASVNMFKGFYRSTFGLVIYSKTLAPVARAAIDQGVRLDRLDAPRREAEEQGARAAAEKKAHEKARAANKAAFRF
jgi:hypothetical protein